MKFKITVIFLILKLITFTSWGVSQILFERRTIDPNFSAFFITNCDLDKDGDQDIISGKNHLAWWVNNGNGGFYKRLIDTNWNRLWSVFPVDLDRDGDIDLITCDIDGEEIRWYKNRNENFEKIVILNNVLRAESLAANDFDKDGDVDIVVVTLDTKMVIWWENDGNMNFNVRHDLADDLRCHKVDIGDINKDGYMDIVVVSTHGLYWWQNLRNKNFLKRTITLYGGLGLEIVDIDKNGSLDIIYCQHSAGNVDLYINNGAGYFSRKAIATQQNWPSWASAGDLNGDGKVDFVFVAGGREENPGELFWFENIGDNNFIQHEVNDSKEGVIFMAEVADFDNDGKEDIVSGYTVAQNKLCWWRNLGSSSFSLSGTVSYYANNELIPNVTMVAKCGVNYIDTTAIDTTGFDGNYYLEVSALEDSINISPFKQKQEHVGPFDITTYDAALTAQHALGVDQLDYNQVIAADTDSNGFIQTFDAALIARHSVGLPPFDFSCVGEWFFLPGNKNFVNINSDITNENFKGIIIGNVHGGWMPPDSNVSKTVVRKNYRNIIKMKQRENDIVVSFHKANKQEVISADIMLVYDYKGLKFVALEKAILLDEFKVLKNVEIGKLRIGMYSVKPMDKTGELLRLIFTKTENVDKVKPIQIMKLIINNEVLINTTSVFELSISGNGLNNFELYQNYPNPFNSATTIKYDVHKDGFGEVKIFNIFGQETRTLVNGQISKGYHETIWDGKDKSGRIVASGVYFYQLKVYEFKSTKKLLMIE